MFQPRIQELPGGLGPVTGYDTQPGSLTRVRSVERLPFTIKVVQTQEDLTKAINIRHQAYARHVPELANALLKPERLDEAPGVAVLLAESNLDGTPLGTMRIQTNRFEPLILEQSVDLPPWLKGHSLAEATRLGVTQKPIGRLVKTALFKAFYQYCLAQNVEWMVIAGRAPVDRQYERLLFTDVFPDRPYVPLKHAGNIPHRILALEVIMAESRWREAQLPFLGFFVDVRHPDLETEHMLGQVV